MFRSFSCLYVGLSVVNWTLNELSVNLNCDWISSLCSPAEWVRNDIIRVPWSAEFSYVTLDCLQRRICWKLAVLRIARDGMASMYSCAVRHVHWHRWMRSWNLPIMDMVSYQNWHCNRAKNWFQEKSYKTNVKWNIELRHYIEIYFKHC